MGDECVFALTKKGEVLSFGQNIDNQLGCEQHLIPFRDKAGPVESAPFAQTIAVGRNSAFAVDAESGEVFGWGSNKYGQILPSDDQRGLLPVSSLKLQLEQQDRLIPSSYFTVLVSRREAIASWGVGRGEVSGG